MYSGSLTGSGGISKIGSGTLTLSGSNSYSGATIISNGWLLVDGSLGAATSVSVTNSGVLGGTGTVNCAVNMNGWAGLAPGGTNIGTLTVSGNMSITDGLLYNWQCDGQSMAADQVNVAGDLSLPPAATVTVARANACGQPARGVLFSYSGECARTDFGGWVVSGGIGTVMRDALNKQIVLVCGGTIIRVK